MLLSVLRLDFFLKTSKRVSFVFSVAEFYMLDWNCYELRLFRYTFSMIETFGEPTKMVLN